MLSVVWFVTDTIQRVRGVRPPAARPPPLGQQQRQQQQLQQQKQQSVTAASTSTASSHTPTPPPSPEPQVAAQQCLDGSGVTWPRCVIWELITPAHRCVHRKTVLDSWTQFSSSIKNKPFLKVLMTKVLFFKVFICKLIIVLVASHRPRFDFTLQKTQSGDTIYLHFIHLLNCTLQAFWSTFGS